MAFGCHLDGIGAIIKLCWRFDLRSRDVCWKTELQLSWSSVRCLKQSMVSRLAASGWKVMTINTIFAIVVPPWHPMRASIVSFVEGKEDEFARFTLVFINNKWCGISSFNRSMPFSSFHPPQKASEGLDSSDTVTTFFEVKFTLLLCTWLCCSHDSEKGLFKCVLSIPLPETNSSHLKMDGWKTIVSFGIQPIFRGEHVSVGEGVDL